jgi:hypothetical protein
MHPTSYPATADTPKTEITTLGAALQSARAVDAPLQQLEYVLAQAMAKAFADMGIKAGERRDEIAYLVQNMPAEVTRTLPCIRISEIPIAINRGILRQFGDFYGLNVATFMHFLITHYQCAQRADAVKKNLAIAQGTAQAPALTAAQLQQSRVNRMVAAFEQYKSQGHYNDYGSLVFDSINALGKIPFGTKKEAEMLEFARQNLVRQYSRGSVYAAERIKLKTNLDELLRGNAATAIITEAKRIALFELFDYLIEMEMTMPEFLGEDVSE